MASVLLLPPTLGGGGFGEWGGEVREGTAPKGRRLQASKLCTMSKPSRYRVAPCGVGVGARTLNSRRCSRGLPLPAGFLLGNREGSFHWSNPPSPRHSPLCHLSLLSQNPGSFQNEAKA